MLPTYAAFGFPQVSFRTAAGEFDLAIRDLQLPDMEGMAIVDATEGSPNRGLPVIFLTGNLSLETAMRPVQQRVTAYLVKPPNLDKLRALIRREAVRYRQRRLLAASRQHAQAWDRELERIEHAPALLART